MEENKIISALMGLVGACNNNPKTENTDQVIIKAVAFPLIQPEADAETIQALIEEIYAEKYAVASGCATCQTPCCGDLEMAAKKPCRTAGSQSPCKWLPCPSTERFSSTVVGKEYGSERTFYRRIKRWRANSTWLFVGQF